MNSSKEKVFEVAVIGLGAVGSSVLYHLSKSGKDAIGIDRFSPPHKMGSSNGETRITRLAVGEGEDYVALAKRSQEIWEKLQEETGQVLINKCGGILMDSGQVPWDKHGSEGFLERTIDFARNSRIPHETMNSEEVISGFPNFSLEKEGRAYFEKSAGYVHPERCIKVQLEMARKLGAVVLENTPVLKIENNREYQQIQFDNNVVFAKKVVITAGGWVKDFLPEEIKNQFKICRQALHWLEIDQSIDWVIKPVFMWGFGPNAEDFIYGFPSLDSKSIKVASESFIDVNHPEAIKREVTREEQRDFFAHKIRGRLNGLTGNVLRSEVCFYTVTEDARFVIENLPDNPDAIYSSACSGHGFKHSAALGEQLAEKILGLELTLPEIK